MKAKNENPSVVIYNSSNIIELLDELTPSEAKEKSWATPLILAMNPELAIPIRAPRVPQAPPASPFEDKNFKEELKDSLSYDDKGLASTLSSLDTVGSQVYHDRKCYETELEDYKHKLEEYKTIEQRQQSLLTASSKFLKGYTGYGVTLEFYAKSTYLKTVIEALSVQVRKYIAKVEKDEPIYITNFKRIIPNMLEMYLLFGKASLNFSKVVADEIVIEDPTQIVNVNMLMFLSSTQVGDKASFYKDKKSLGWKDYDPIYYVDVLRLPYLQAEMKLSSAEDIKNNYTQYSGNNISNRYDLEWSIPIVGDKVVARERLSLLGGDASLLMDNLYLFGMIEMASNVLRTHIPLSMILHYKDTSLGAGTLLEGNNGYSNDALQESIGEAAREGDFPVLFTTTNDEVRLNEIPLKDLPNARLNFIREVFSKHDMLTPEQVSSLKDVQRSGAVIEYKINNVLKPVFEKYINTLLSKGRIKTSAEADKWLKQGVFDVHPRVDLRNKDDFSGYLEIFNSLASLGGQTKIKTKSYEKIFKHLTGLDIEFEDIKQETLINKGDSNGEKRSIN